MACPDEGMVERAEERQPHAPETDWKTMKLLNSGRIRSIGLSFCAVGLAACSFLTTQSAPPQASAQHGTTPQASQTAFPSPTPTIAGPTPSPMPTVAPTPVPPQPISFANAADLQIIREYENYDQQADVFSRAVSPDGRLLAMGGCLIEDDNQCHVKTYFRLFDVNTGQMLFDLDYLSPAIQVLAFSPDDKVLAAAGCDISLYIYGEMDTICDIPRVWLVSTETGKVIAELKGYTSHVTDFAFSPDGSTLFTSVEYDRLRGDGDHVIRAYDAHTGEKISTIETGMITCTEMYLDMSPDGHYLAANVTSACGSQSFVAWWDVQDPAHPRQVGNANAFGRFRISPDGTQILLNNRHDNTIMLYDLATGNSIKLIPSVPYQSSLNTYDYLNDSNTILLDVSYEYDIIDLTTGKVVHRITPQAGQYMGSYLLTPDRSTLFVIASSGSAVDVWDPSSWQSYPLQLDPNNTWTWQNTFGTTRLVFSPDRTQLLAIDSGNGNFRAQFWGFKDPTQEQAAQALRHYFDLLSNGQYQEASQMYAPYSDVSAEVGTYALVYPWAPDYLQSLVPEVTITDTVRLLTLLCQDQTFPCMPVRDVLYQSQIWDHLYRFAVTFAGPDGEQAKWPLCQNVPAAKWCEHRNGDFEFYVLQMPDGSFHIVDGLPPAINLRVK
jgi:WD40 repeat protein